MRPPSPILDRTDWPPNYVQVWAWRQHQVRRLMREPALIAGAYEYYRTRPVEWITHWADTYDPRNAGTGRPTRMPLIPFAAQVELIEFVVACIRGEVGGLVEKSRDMGATWICCAVSVWMWLYWPGAAIGWGSRKEALVDKLGDPDSIFEKMRMILDGLPGFFLPDGYNRKEHATYMRIVNPDNGATITGEAGDNIGRGGRKLVYFKDEAAHYERPEVIEAALGDNTRVPIDISSVNGTGNVFERRRKAGVDWTGEIEPGRTHVFVMDWRDHPDKDERWYEERRKRAETEGLLHIFEQEVNRNYSASVEGIVIPSAWVQSAIDAHLKLGWDISGGKVAGLDVADEGGDKNALAIRHGVLLEYVDDWARGDTGQTTRRAVAECAKQNVLDIQYDSIGVGAGVKAEANRLAAEGELPKGMQFTPWNAGSAPNEPDERVERGDRDTPTNRDFYANLKAQAWWELRRRFERTHQAVTEDAQYSIDDMISIPSTIPKLNQLTSELSQATYGHSGAMKIKIDKTPAGTRSPNLADAVAMCYCPIRITRYTLAAVR